MGKIYLENSNELAVLARLRLSQSLRLLVAWWLPARTRSPEIIYLFIPVSSHCFLRFLFQSLLNLLWMS